MRLQHGLAGVYNFPRREFNFDSLKFNKAEQQPLSGYGMMTVQNRIGECPKTKIGH